MAGSDEVYVEVKSDLEVACEEPATEEPCIGCGEVHEEPVRLDHVLRKQKRLYRLTVTGYLISLIATAYCAYELLGPWGASGCVALFGVYFFHMNMVALVRVLMTLEEATFGAMMAGKQAEQAEQSKDDEVWGNYA